jgi:hypothetical protein
MQLVALLVVVVITALLMGRLGGGPAGPGGAEQPARRTLPQVEKLVEGAGQKNQQRLEEAMKGLR